MFNTIIFLNDDNVNAIEWKPIGNPKADILDVG